MSDMYDRIETLLKKKNLSKRQLAIKAGIPYQTLVSAFRRRSEGLSLEYKLKIAEVLEVNLSDLYDVDFSEFDKRFHSDWVSISVKFLEMSERYEPLTYNLLSRYYQLNDTGMEKTISYVDGLLESSEFDKPEE